MIRLSVRLQAIYDWLDGQVIADIGCDHGYIPLRFVQETQKKAYACDVAEKPLERAARLFEQEGVSIDCLLMDGIETLPDDVDQLVIAGMGGALMCQILKKELARAQQCESMILSPHKDAPLLRTFLTENGFEIVRERVVFEAGHYYPILYVVSGQQRLETREIYLGCHVLQDETYVAFLDSQLKKWRALEKKVPEKDFSRGRQMIRLLKEQIELQK